MSLTHKEIDNELVRLETLRSELLEEQAKLNELSSEKVFANEIHKQICDKHLWTSYPCEFFEEEYQENTWSKKTHKVWLKRAKELMKKFPNLTSANIVDIVEIIEN